MGKTPIYSIHVFREEFIFKFFQTLTNQLQPAAYKRAAGLFLTRISTGRFIIYASAFIMNWTNDLPDSHDVNCSTSKNFDFINQIVSAYNHVIRKINPVAKD
jgi:hypothetical protein